MPTPNPLRDLGTRSSCLLRAAAIAAAVACGTNGAHAQRGNPDLAPAGESIDALIAAFMREQSIPGLALAIVQAPYITRATGHGLGNVAQKRLVATNTLFGLGEMAEAYTAVAIMQLVELGKVGLDDPIARHLPATPTPWQGVTVRQLLQHQSGVPDYTGSQQAQSAPASDGDLLAGVASMPLAFPPGTQVRRSATDYLLLQLLVETASGERYERFVRQHQLDRLGLRQTYFASELDHLGEEDLGSAGNEKHRRFLQEPRLINPTERAVGYESATKPARRPNLRLLPERTALYASASDISIWDIGLAGGILIKDPALRQALYTPARLRDGTTAASSGPWWFPGHRGLMIATGSRAGFSALLSRFTDPNELLCVTLLANKEGVDLTQLARRIAAAFDPALGPPPHTANLRIQQSPFSPGATLDRFEQALRHRGVNVIARLDHAQAATRAGLELGPVGEIIFGNPALGTHLMRSNPAIAADLPLRVAAWEHQGEVWLAGPDPVDLARRNGVTDRAEVALQMRTALDATLLEAVAGNR